MGAEKKHDNDAAAGQAEELQAGQIVRTVVNGHVYRSRDGINWEIETDADAAPDDKDEDSAKAPSNQ